MALGVSFSGLDYVSHEDILPYSSTDQVPIQHELFERFLMYDQTKGNFWHHCVVLQYLELIHHLGYSIKLMVWGGFLLH